MYQIKNEQNSSEQIWELLSTGIDRTADLSEQIWECFSTYTPYVHTTYL